jgi:hypothetical protein
MEIDRLVSMIAEKVSEGECVLFLGAGVHAPPPEGSTFEYPDAHRPPLLGQLVADLAEKCDFHKQLPHDAGLDLQRVSLCVEKTPGLGRPWLVERLDQFMEAAKPSPLLRMLAEMPFTIFVTTNYDNLLETALTEAGKRPQKIVYDPTPERPARPLSRDPSVQRPLVFKIHGDLDEAESIVITDEDYIHFVQRLAEKESANPVPPMVKLRLSMWPTLFVGYSLRDYNLRLLFRTLRWGIDRAFNPGSYSVDRAPDELIKRVYQDNFMTFLVCDMWSAVPRLRELVGANALQTR